jgi:hypothetical protein
MSGIPRLFGCDSNGPLLRELLIAYDAIEGPLIGPGAENGLPSPGQGNSEIFANAAKAESAGARHPIVGFDVVSDRTLIVVVIDFGAWKLRMKWAHFSHGSTPVNSGDSASRNVT